MRQRHHQGVWEIFLPGVRPGARYKYEIRSRVTPVPFLKADPCAAAYEHPPATASIVMAPSAHVWQDADWIDARRAAREGFDRPMAIYEVHLGSWARTPDNRFLTYGELAERLVPYVKELGFTHVELLPVLEFPYDG